MQNIDPQMAARVWQRVQAANDRPCAEKTACPLEGIRTVPAMPVMQKVSRPCKKQRKTESYGEFPLWLLAFFILCM